MRVPPPFAVRAGQIALDLPGGHVVFSTPAGGDLAPGAAGPTAALRGLVGPPPERWVQDVQVHGARVRTIGADDPIRPMSGEFDGQVTARTDVACVVRVADCLPVALVAPEAVGVLHAGWRSLAAGVVEVGVAALRALGASEIRAAIGPGAGVCCYRAGEEVHAAFAADGPGARSGDHADLAAVARRRLRACAAREVHDTAICTICAAPGELFSHRRGEAGRQAVIAWRS